MVLNSNIYGKFASKILDYNIKKNYTNKFIKNPHNKMLILLLGLNFLPQPLQANTRPLCCQILCWLDICKDLKALSQKLQGWTCSLSLVLCPPHWSHPATKWFPLQTCPRHLQGQVPADEQLSTPLHVLLKADPRLEGDVADDKADPSVCLQLNQISVLQYF